MHCSCSWCGAASRPAGDDGEQLTLTPASDICPQARAGGEATQAMAFARDRLRMSQLTGCVDAAKEYELSANEAREIIDHQIDVTRTTGTMPPM